MPHFSKNDNNKPSILINVNYILESFSFSEDYSEEEITAIKTEYNRDFLVKNPDVLLIKPETEAVAEMYRNHGTFHEGDSGLDLFCVRDQTIVNGSTDKIRLGIQCQTNTSFWLVPRSSISKTPLRMANSIGLIDKGYRGEIMGVVDYYRPEPPGMCGAAEYKIKEGDRLFQIAFADLREIRPIVTSFLGASTRGTGGFGSTNTH